MSLANSLSNSEIKFINVSELGNLDDYQAFDCKPKNDQLLAQKDIETYEEINDFIADDAISMSLNNLTQTYVLTVEKEIIAYCSMFADSVQLGSKYKRSKEVVNSDRVSSYPAISIMYFGVNNKYQGNNYGKLLMSYIFEQIHQLSFFVGITLIQVHALESAVDFYKKQGFDVYGAHKQIKNIEALAITLKEVEDMLL